MRTLLYYAKESSTYIHLYTYSTYRYSLGKETEVYFIKFINFFIGNLTKIFQSETGPRNPDQVKRVDGDGYNTLSSQMWTNDGAFIY